MKFKDLSAGSLFVYGRRQPGQVLRSEVFIKLCEPLRHSLRRDDAAVLVTAVNLAGEHKQPPNEAVVSRVLPAEDMVIKINEGRSFGSLAVSTSTGFFVWSSAIQVKHVERLTSVCLPLRPVIHDHRERITRNTAGFDGNTYQVDGGERVTMVLLDGAFRVVDESTRPGPNPEANVTTTGLVVVAEIPVFLDSGAGPLPPGWQSPRRR